MVIRYCAYYPDEDAVNNCGFIMAVDDFLKYRPEDDPEDNDMRAGTRHLPTDPFGDFDAKHGGVALGVPCPDDDGFTALDLRAAATMYRKQQGLPC